MSRLKKVFVSCSSLFLIALHIPFTFAKMKPVNGSPVVKRNIPAFPNKILKNTGNNSAITGSTLINIYDSLRLQLKGLSRGAFNAAIKGFNYLAASHQVASDKIISIIDFSLPSFKKRLFVIDLKNYKIIFNTYVAHGVNSGREYARQFSNIPESNKSSLGFYITRNTYIGDNGYSLRLHGLESGINDNASARDIVIHGAEYVSENFIRSQGFIGRSWGCPALPMNLHKPIIDKIKNGTCLFIFGKDPGYLKRSRILNS